MLLYRLTRLFPVRYYPIFLKRRTSFEMQHSLFSMKVYQQNKQAVDTISGKLSYKVRALLERQNSGQSESFLSEPPSQMSNLLIQDNSVLGFSFWPGSDTNLCTCAWLSVAVIIILTLSGSSSALSVEWILTLSLSCPIRNQSGSMPDIVPFSEPIDNPGSQYRFQ